MRKYFIGVVSVSLAIIFLSFAGQDSEDSDNESSSSIWWHVKLGTKKINCSSVIRSDFDDILDPN